MDSAKKYRISNLAAGVLLLVAGIFDLLTLIPLVGTFIGWVFWIGAGLYFWKAGLGIVNWKRAVPSLLSLVAEFVPVVQEFPSIIAAIAVIIVISRIEDKTGLPMSVTMKGKSLNSGGVRAPSGVQTPVNANGVRAVISEE